MLNNLLNRFLRILQKIGLTNVIGAVLRKLGLLKITFRMLERVMAMDVRGSKSEAIQIPPDGLPLPPSDLIVMVDGFPHIGWFLHWGKVTFEIIISTLKRNGVSVETLSSVLEFGCGCGRVLRHWHSIQGPQIYGVDYNQQLVDWCRKNLPFVRVANNDLRPPLHYEDGLFDCVYAISVFTHMAEDLQLAWMSELRRVIRPGGYLIITTHGVSSRDKLTRRERKAFDAGYLVVRYGEASGMNLCNAYHPQEYVRQRMSVGFEVKDFMPAGTQGVLYQDLYLLRKD